VFELYVLYTLSIVSQEGSDVLGVVYKMHVLYTLSIVLQEGSDVLGVVYKMHVLYTLSIVLQEGSDVLGVVYKMHVLYTLSIVFQEGSDVLGGPRQFLDSPSWRGHHECGEYRFIAFQVDQSTFTFNDSLDCTESIKT